MNDPLLMLRNLVSERIGLFLRDENIDLLKDRLTSLADGRGPRSLADYCNILRGSDEAAHTEWHYVITEFSKPASSFYRHREHARTLAEIVMPRLAAARYDTVRIFSAGCSTGEEPLTLAMALDDAGWFDRFDIEISAVDGNLASLEKARLGLYDDMRVRQLPEKWRGKYFEAEGGDQRVKRQLRARITWSEANIADPGAITAFAPADIIYCRNVFIYFSDELIRRTLAQFAEMMPPGGYLFSDGGDYFDALVADTGAFESQKLDGVSIWKRIEKN